MFATFFLFLPVAICLLWGVLYPLLSFRTSTFHVMTILLFVLGVFLFSDSCYATRGVSFRYLGYINIVAQAAAPSVIPLSWLYLTRLRKDDRYRPFMMLWLVFPVMLFTSGLILFSISGPDVVDGFLEDFYSNGFSVLGVYRGTSTWSYYVWSVLVFRMVLLVELLFLVVYLIRVCLKDHYSLKNLFAFCFKGGRVSPAHLQVLNIGLLYLLMAIKVFFLWTFLPTHSWVVILLSALLCTVLFAFGFVSLFGAKDTVSLQEMGSVMRYNYRRENKGAVVEQMISDLVEEAEEEALKHIMNRLGGRPDSTPAEELAEGHEEGVADAIFSAVAESWEDDSLLSRFQHLMVDDRLFLQSGLTLGDVAERLKTNKTYVSKLVNNTYNLGFPELLNTLRVDYAEQYILSHRDAKQTEIAKACGFVSASSFNNTFKRLTGVTPKVWVASHGRQRKK